VNTHCCIGKYHSSPVLVYTLEHSECSTVYTHSDLDITETLQDQGHSYCEYNNSSDNGKIYYKHPKNRNTFYCLRNNDSSDYSGKLKFPTMYTLMFLQKTLLPEWLITHITGKWPLPTMNALMLLQITSPSEWLNTCIAGKWPLQAMYLLMFF
jgi:hypothetical protein